MRPASDRKAGSENRRPSRRVVLGGASCVLLASTLPKPWLCDEIVLLDGWILALCDVPLEARSRTLPLPIDDR